MEWLESRAVRPRQARYQAALRPDMQCFTYSRAVRDTAATPTLARFELFRSERPGAGWRWRLDAELDHAEVRLWLAQARALRTAFQFQPYISFQADMPGLIGFAVATRRDNGEIDRT
jgi:hypothetical protein